MYSFRLTSARYGSELDSGSVQEPLPKLLVLIGLGCDLSETILLSQAEYVVSY